jgi:hypothetical protein
LVGHTGSRRANDPTRNNSRKTLNKSRKTLSKSRKTRAPTRDADGAVKVSSDEDGEVMLHPTWSDRQNHIAQVLVGVDKRMAHVGHLPGARHILLHCLHPRSPATCV